MLGDREELEVLLERWKKVFKERGLKINRNNTTSSTWRSQARNGVHIGGNGEEG